MSTAYIAVGSNLGDKRENCNRGIDALERIRDITVTGRAGFYKTAPVDYTDQDWFVNTAIRIDTRLSPDDLLIRLKKIEQESGRKRGGIRFGPRVLDLDIIFYDDLVLQTRVLDIPHPRMHKRRFVLRPICDIDPSAMHPTLESPVKVLLEAIKDPDQDIELLR
ncbi:MAG: 2-amino-4-hydroxy-6-hydroxymethyldihydropteridine diphosphokinase [Desulfobacterales bacterium]|nr:2-amino-4-hydroxy-6-hydroxymethyldihydropteridine diphosphokinase [Desulfobacterales bacterium]